MERAGAEELVELGSGTASKTRALLYAMAGQGSLERYVPFDVDESVVHACAAELTEIYPGLEVHGVVGDFGRDLERIPDGRRRLFAFLGGTIGNLYPAERARFLAAHAADDGSRRPARDRHRPRQGPGGARGRLQRQRRASRPSSTATCCG